MISTNGYFTDRIIALLQRALQPYVTITVPYNVLLAIYLTPVFPRGDRRFAVSYVLGGKTPICAALFCAFVALLRNGLFRYGKKRP